MMCISHFSSKVRGPRKDAWRAVEGCPLAVWFPLLNHGTCPNLTNRVFSALGVEWGTMTNNF